MEEAAEETARTVEARARAAASKAALLVSERTAAEETARIAKARAGEECAKAEEKEAEARAAQAEAEAAEHLRAAAEIAELAAASERTAAEIAELAAETRARAASAEALSDLSQVQIKERVVARLLLTNPHADGAAIAERLGGASASTASTYRKAAEGLIAQGYPDHDPDLSAPWFADTAATVIPGQTEITV